MWISCLKILPEAPPISLFPIPVFLRLYLKNSRCTPIFKVFNKMYRTSTSIKAHMRACCTLQVIWAARRTVAHAFFLSIYLYVAEICHLPLCYVLATSLGFCSLKSPGFLSSRVSIGWFSLWLVITHLHFFFLLNFYLYVQGILKDNLRSIPDIFL